MKDAGLQRAIEQAGGVSALAASLGIAQPSVSGWTRVPAERVTAVEDATGVPRHELRPDLFAPSALLSSGLQVDAPPTAHGGGDAAAPFEIDEVDQARGELYLLLGSLLRAPPDAALLETLAELKSGPTPLGLAQLGLAEAARVTTPKAVSREFFDLFIGVGRGELLPYASYYLTGFLHERPLARVREEFRRLGIERAEGLREPEDHLGILFEVMGGLCLGRFGAAPFDGTDAERVAAQERVFAGHVAPFALRALADLGLSKSAKFYRSVAALGSTFLEIETEGFALPA